MTSLLNFEPSLDSEVADWLNSALNSHRLCDVFTSMQEILDQIDPNLHRAFISKLAFLEAQQSDFNFDTLAKISILKLEIPASGFLNPHTGFKFPSSCNYVTTLTGEIYDQSGPLGKSFLKGEALICWLGYLCGSISSAIGIVVEHVKTRKQFDRLVGSFQLVQDNIVKVFIDFEYLKNALYFLCEYPLNDENVLATLLNYSPEVFSKLDLLIQACGGIGFTEEFPLSRYFKRAVNLLTVAL